MADLSIKGEAQSIPDFDALVLGTFSANFIQETQFVTDEFFSDDFLESIRLATASFPSGVMPRLGYCSWKYSMLINEPAYDVTSVLKIISRDDPRVGGLLARELITEQEIFLHLREWHDIPHWSEFRLFIRDRKIAGVSQYHHQEAYPEIQENLKAIKASLIPFSRQLIDALQFDWSHDVVVLGGVEQKIRVAHFRLCHSRKPFIVAYLRESQEMVLDAFNRAFAFYGGVPRRVIVDNAKTMVAFIGKGKERRFHSRFLACMSHYAIEPSSIGLEPMVPQ